MSAVDALADLKNVLYVDRIYNALQTLRRRDDECAKKQIDLRTAELRLFSQNGEDGILNAILRALGDSPKFFVEFGVGDGWSCNTRLLAEVFDWGGLFIEVDDNDYSSLSERYRHSRQVRCVPAAVTPENVNGLFDLYEVPHRFGILSIDIDGQDYWVWKALDQRYQPDIVVVEFNSYYGPDAMVVEQAGIPAGMPLTSTWGCSLGAVKALGESKGYQLLHVEMAGVNAFFVRKDLLHAKELTFTGIMNRSPNFGLRGRNHRDVVLYGDGDRTERPQSDVL